MNPMLAFTLEHTLFGPAPTIIGTALAAFWFFVILRRHHVERPLYRFGGILLFAISLSMLLGLNRDAFQARGGFGGLWGAWVASGLSNVHWDGVAFWLLLLAVLGSIPLATEWFFVPFVIRLQSGDRSGRPAFAGINAIRGSTFSAAGGMLSRNSSEDDSTQDPVASSGSATAVEEPPSDLTGLRGEPAASDSGVPAGIYEQHSEERVFSMPADDELLTREEVARLNEPDPDADVPWYARRKRRREEAAALERALDEPPVTDQESTEDTRAANAEAVEELPYRRYRRGREVEPEAATSDLTTELADAVPTVEDPRAEESPAAHPGADESGEPVVESAPSDSSPPAKQAAVEDDFADFLNSATETVSDGLVAPPTVEVAPEPAVERSPYPEPRSEAVTRDSESPRIEVAPEPAPAPSGDDPDRALFLSAGDAVVDGGRASISFLQRTLSVGYFQAAKLLDRLEKEGVIGPYTGAVSRKVLIDATDWSAKKQSL